VNSQIIAMLLCLVPVMWNNFYPGSQSRLIEKNLYVAASIVLVSKLR